MDIYTQFNRKSIQDRQIDTLIGISKGITADGEVNYPEAEFLLTWLIQNGHSESPIVINLLNKVSDILEDGALDDEESKELLETLRKISGEQSAVGEVAKTSALPLCSPAPKIVFEDRTFLFTGTFIFGTRKHCQEATESLGGIFAKGVNKKVDYLVIGDYVTNSWAHESFGRKIEKAISYRDAGVSLSIVAERHWLDEAGLAPAKAESV